MDSFLQYKKEVADTEILWNKLPTKEINCKPYQKRVLEFDPANVPNLFKIKSYHRHQNVSILQLFPKIVLCACGCGREVIGNRRRWATDECQSFAVAVRFIIYGAADSIAKYLRLYYGWRCCRCNCEDKGHDMGRNGCVSWIKVDHIIPVKLGGGACWLSNYQLLCHDCHVNKTNIDFNWKQTKNENRINTLYV